MRVCMAKVGVGKGKGPHKGKNTTRRKLRTTSALNSET